MGAVRRGWDHRTWLTAHMQRRGFPSCPLYGAAATAHTHTHAMRIANQNRPSQAVEENSSGAAGQPQMSFGLLIKNGKAQSWTFGDRAPLFPCLPTLRIVLHNRPRKTSRGGARVHDCPNLMILCWVQPPNRAHAHTHTHTHTHMHTHLCRNQTIRPLLLSTSTADRMAPRTPRQASEQSKQHKAGQSIEAVMKS